MKRTGPVRRHGQPGVRRPGSAGQHLREDRDAHLVVLDGGDRHLQLAPDAGAGDREVRHPEQKSHWLPEAGLRRDPRRPGADRAGRGHRPAGHPHDGAPRRRRLRHQRHQDLDHQRDRRPLLRAAGQDRSGGPAAPQGHEPVHRAQGPAASSGTPPVREAGLQVHRLRRAGRRRTIRSRQGAPDRRRRRPGLLPGDRRPGAGPHQRRLARRRHRRGRAAAGHRIRAESARPSASRSPSTRRSA